MSGTHTGRDWFGAIAQLGERLHGMQEVSGSIPLGSTTIFPINPEFLTYCVARAERGPRRTGDKPPLSNILNIDERTAAPWLGSLTNRRPSDVELLGNLEV